MRNIPIALPFITADEYRQVKQVLDSRQLSLGRKYQEFERQFARQLGFRYARTVSSGTTGLHLALLAAGIGPGDEVITSPFSFIASANAILYVGATPVFADIEPTTYNLDPKHIERRVTKRTKAILVVHIFGQSAEMRPIMRLAHRHRLKVIEDACESIGATYHRKKVGTFGESAVFAFYPNKQMTTGEGGMIVTSSRRIANLCASLRNQGRSNSMEWLDHDVLGYNYRMDELSAAVGLAQLKKLKFMIRQRQRVATTYTRLLSPFAALVTPPAVVPHRTHTWFVYVVRLAPRLPRRPVIETLKARGIHTKVYLPSIHLFDFYRKRFNFHRGDYPVSESVSDTSLALPIYPQLSDRDVAHIVRTLITVIKSYA